jgi:hypothetical protein
MSTDETPLTEKAVETLEHAKRVFANTKPQIDPWTRATKPVMFAAVAAKHPEAIDELVNAGYLAPALGPSMWGFYVKGERLNPTSKEPR